MNKPQTLRFNRHQVRGKLCGAYVFIGKNTPLWTAVHRSNAAGIDWSVATFARDVKDGRQELFLRPFACGIGWKSVRLQVVKSGAFRLYIPLVACPPIEGLPKKFSIEGTTVLTGGLVAWAGLLPEQGAVYVEGIPQESYVSGDLGPKQETPNAVT